MADFIQIEDKTLYKAIDNDRLKVEIGGSTDYFAPSVNFSYRLGSDTEEFFLNICDDESQIVTDKVIETVDKDLISVRVDNVESTFKSSAGGLKIERIFYTKPTEAPKYKLLFSKGISFLYQGELTQEDIDFGCSRPDDVVGSYAVYCDRKNHIKGQANYGCGKLGHLFAPYWTDAIGNKIKGTQVLSNYTLTFQLPDQKWLDIAVLPIKLDPNLGYDTAGASSLSASYPISTSTGFSTDGTGGVVSSYFCHINTGGNDRTITGALYDNASPNRNRLYLTNESVENESSAAWVEITSFAETGGSLSASTTYHPGWDSNGGSTNISYDSGQSVHLSGIETDLPDPWDTTVDFGIGAECSHYVVYGAADSDIVILRRRIEGI